MVALGSGPVVVEPLTARTGRNKRPAIDPVDVPLADVAAAIANVVQAVCQRAMIVSELDVVVDEAVSQNVFAC